VPFRRDASLAMFKFLRRGHSAVDPDAAVAEASSHLRTGNLGEAERLLQQVLAGEAEHGGAVRGLGAVRMRQGQWEEAVVLLERAARIDPEDAGTLVELGNALNAWGRPAQALAQHERALGMEPSSVPAWCGRADALRALRRDAEAVECYSSALALEPEHVGVLVNRANLLHALGRHGEALADYDLALLFDPGATVVCFNRGVALQAIGRREDAVAAYRSAIERKPDYLAALQNLAVVLGELHRHDEELKCYERIVAIAPDYPHALGNVAHVRAQLAQWNERAALVAAVEEAIARGKPAAVPFVFMTLSQDPAAQLACAAGHVAARHNAGARALAESAYDHDRIRIAYVSADFHDHAMTYLMAGLFDRHDRERFEVTAVSMGPDADGVMRPRLTAAFERFVDVRGRSDYDIARTMHDLEIDIAIDLMGFTGGARTDVFAHRPAPVQVNYLGYPGTMGAAFIDYILADRFVIPPELAQFYAEKVVYLPDTFQANDDARAVPDVTPARAAAGLPEGAFVFCSFNNTYKITPEMFDIWMRLLRRVEHGVLWLFGGSETVVANLRREARSRGVDGDRLVFGAKLPYRDHLARYRCADLFLDTVPFNAGTTASDALWAGLPLLTCAGRAFAARMAGSLLHAAGLPELVTGSLDAYEALAVRLATHPDMLGELRERLARNRTQAALFDTDRFRRNVEKAYRRMWEISRAGERPHGFGVNG
jgi:protein O-GlcNAc transferase